MRHIAAITLLVPIALFAQKPTPKATSATEHEVLLPVTHVSLYKNGVGFFEHTGQISGNAAVALSFTSGQLNDVLQSLTAIDLNGGRIAGAGYNSTTPLDQQLKALSLGLPEKTTFSGLFTALRGTHVEITGSGAPFTGRIVDIEMHKTIPGPSQTKDQTDMTEGRFLTIASDNGTVRIFQMTPTLSVRLTDTAAHTDLTQYLTLLDQNRNQGLRHLTINDNGTGFRTLKLSYISEVPIWKSTYRILFTDAATSPTTQTATLQGWSVVDNTTGTDWINVHLSLIAGAPQSFIQPLSQPIYSRRPEVPIAEASQLTPQTHDSSILTTNDIAQLSKEGRDVTERLKVLPGTPVSSQQFMAMPASIGSGYGSGSGGNTGGGVMRGVMGGLAAGPAISYEQAATDSLTAQTTTAAFDDFFAYNLTEPVTIRKNESALVPILQAKLPVDNVTLVSSNGFTTAQPLRALWITNSSGLTLDRGSFSIVENGNFGGEGLLDPIHPGEKRLLSYAADQAVHVSIKDNHTTQHIESITASKGVLQLHRSELHEITYVVHNAAADTRTIVLEEPVVQGFTLDSDTPGSADPKPVETTPTVYRFRLTVAPGETARLHSSAKRKGASTYQLTNSDENQIAFILRETGDNPALTAALQPILATRRQLADAQLAVNQTNDRLTALRADEDRQRANITALANADRSSRDRFIRDLNKTEDAIAAAQSELTTRTTAQQAAQSNLSTLIESLQLNETL